MKPSRSHVLWTAVAIALQALILSPIAVTTTPRHLQARERTAPILAPSPTPPLPVEPPHKVSTLGVTVDALAAYASSTSVTRGGTIAFAVSTPSPTYDVAVDRFAGAGPAQQRLLVRKNLQGRDQGYWIRATFGVHHCPTCAVDRRTGEVQPNWAWTFALTVPRQWPSGLYRAVFTSAGGADAVPFVVKADGEPAPLLVVISFSTYEAYNDWGGKSLYAYNSVGPRTVAGNAEAAMVSFLRPYATWTPTAPPVIGYGTASDWMLAAWLAQHRLTADFASDIDIAANPELVHGRRLIIFAGHSEYWSQAEFEAALSAREGGTSLAFLGGNDVYWRVRYQGAYQTLIEYRVPSLDPLSADPTQVTGLFDSPQVGEPQSELTGTLYESGVPTYELPWTVTADAPAWLLRGSGLQAGASIQHAVGGECDRYYPSAPQPAGVMVVAQTSFLHGRAVCSSTLYQASSGAWVFNAGDMDWDLHLLSSGAIAAITGNVVAKFSGL